MDGTIYFFDHLPSLLSVSIYKINGDIFTISYRLMTLVILEQYDYSIFYFCSRGQLQGMQATTYNT